MSLMGRPLIIVLAVCTVAFPLLVFFGWSRLAHPVLGRLGRLGLVGASQLSAVLLVAVLLNDYGYFYATWGELFQGAAAAAAITSPKDSAGSGAQGIAFHPGDPGGTLVHLRRDRHFSLPSARHTRGALDRMRLVGASSQLAEGAEVYLPPQYFAKADAHRRFPALVVLTGYPGGPRQLVSRLRYPDALRHDLSHGTAKPMILVMMRPSVTFPRDTECTDVPGGPQAFTYFSQDVPAAIDAHYRVQDAHWGAIGDSTGGYCSAKLAMTDPATFRAAVSLSGYFTTLQDHTTGDLWGGSSVVRHLNDLDWRLRHQPAPDVSMLVTTSRDENGPYGHRNTERFMSLVKPPMTVQSIIEPHGGHTFTTWKPEIPESLAWLSRKLHR